MLDSLRRAEVAVATAKDVKVKPAAKPRPNKADGAPQAAAKGGTPSGVEPGAAAAASSGSTDIPLVDFLPLADAFSGDVAYGDKPLEAWLGELIDENFEGGISEAASDAGGLVADAGCEDMDEMGHEVESATAAGKQPSVSVVGLAPVEMVTDRQAKLAALSALSEKAT